MNSADKQASKAVEAGRGAYEEYAKPVAGILYGAFKEHVAPALGEAYKQVREQVKDVLRRDDRQAAEVQPSEASGLSTTEALAAVDGGSSPKV